MYYLAGLVGSYNDRVRARVYHTKVKLWLIEINLNVPPVFHNLWKTQKRDST